MVSRQKKKKATELDHIVSSERGNKRGRNSISGESFAFRSSLKAIEERRASDWLLAVHSGNPHTPRLPALPGAKPPLALSPSLSLSLPLSPSHRGMSSSHNRLGFLALFWTSMLALYLYRIMYVRDKISRHCNSNCVLTWQNLMAL